MRVAREQVRQRHHEPGCAEAALDRPRIDQRALDTREAALACDAFDRRDCALPDVDCKREACARKLSVEEHVARAADAVIAAALGPGEADSVAKRIEQRPGRGR